MQLEFDTLKTAQQMRRFFDRIQAENLVQVLSGIQFRNIYSEKEVDDMLSESVERVFTEWRAERQADRRAERLAERHAERRAEWRAERAERAEREKIRIERRKTRLEARQNTRRLIQWTVGTVVSVGVALATYLSALIHLSH